VGLVAGGLLLLALRLSFPSRVALVLSAAGALLYGTLVGSRPPVLRALAMLTAAAAGHLVGRRSGGLRALVWAAAVVALLLPEEVPRPGYQLSFAACAALVLAGPGSGSWVRRLAAASLAAQAGTLPLVLLHFGRVAPFALPANLLGLPLVTFAVGASLGAPVLHLLWPAAGEAAAALAREAAGLLLGIATLAAELPGSGRMLAAVGPLWCLVATLAVLAALAARGPRRLPPAGVVLLLLACGPLRSAPSLPPPGAVEIVALDVGQGSALLITTAKGERLLVDGGGSPGSDYPVGERLLLPQLRGLGVSRLDLLALTHPDADHGEGLEAVLGALPVGRLVLPGEDCGHPLARRLAASAARRGVPTEGWWAGHRIGRAGLAIEVLAPGRGSSCGANDQSLVLRLAAAGGALLLPGDIERAGERALLDREAPLEARVLVLPHHGSAGSSSPEFLDAVGPALALVQAGEGNAYGHPDPGLLEELRRRGVRLYRSDRDGTVRALLLADGRLRVERITR
jgi:competence protein ComEC